MRLYLSGAIRGILNHREQFTCEAYKLRQADYYVLDPHDITKECGETCSINQLTFNSDTNSLAPDVAISYKHSWECCLRYDLIGMLECDGIAVMDGAHASRGSNLEVFIAHQIGMPVLSVSNWIAQGAQL